jgi:hypothetical protein
MSDFKFVYDSMGLIEFQKFIDDCKKYKTKPNMIDLGVLVWKRNFKEMIFLLVMQKFIDILTMPIWKFFLHKMKSRW